MSRSFYSRRVLDTVIFFHDADIILQSILYFSSDLDLGIKWLDSFKGEYFVKIFHSEHLGLKPISWGPWRLEKV